MSNLTIRPMQADDVQGVHALESRVFGNDAWDLAMFEGEQESGQALVAVHDNKLCAYLCSYVAADEYTLANIAVDPNYEGKGIASQMLVQSMANACGKGSMNFWLEVRPGNDRARAMYRHFGFVDKGIRKNYYENPVEDAVIMGKCWSDAPLAVTQDLWLRCARPRLDEAQFICDLWNNPQVMSPVGLPNGTGDTAQTIITRLAKAGESPVAVPLLVLHRATGKPIGQAYMGKLDQNGVCETDVKLHPKYWGQGWGKQVKQALVDYLFTYTQATAVRATPNTRNAASIKMQQAVGARCVGQGSWQPPKDSKMLCCQLEYFVFELTRSQWEANKVTQETT